MPSINVNNTQTPAIILKAPKKAKATRQFSTASSRARAAEGKVVPPPSLPPMKFSLEPAREVKPKEKKGRGGLSLLKVLKKLVPCASKKSIKNNFADDNAAMDFASPRLDVQLSPKRTVTEEERAERLVAIRERIAEKKREEEEERRRISMVARKEKRLAAMFAPADEEGVLKTATNAERDVAVPFNAPDFHPAYVYGHHLDKAMNVDHKKLERYARKYEEVSRPAVGIVGWGQGDNSYEVEDADSDIGEMTFAGPEPEVAIKEATYEYEDVEEVVRPTVRQRLAVYGVVHCDVPKGLPSRPYTKLTDPADRLSRYKWVSKGKEQNLKLRKKDVYARGYRPYHPQTDLTIIDEDDDEELSELDSAHSSPVIQTPVLETFGELEVEVVVDDSGHPDEDKVKVVGCQGSH